MTVPLLRQHVFAEDLAGAQRTQQINVENLRPGLFQAVDRGAALCYARRVDENVDPPKLRNNRFVKFLDRPTAAHIHLLTERPSSQCFDRGRRLFDLLLAPRGGHDVRMGGGETQCDSSAQAGSAANDDRTSARKIKELHTMQNILPVKQNIEEKQDPTQISAKLALQRPQAALILSKILLHQHLPSAKIRLCWPVCREELCFCLSQLHIRPGHSAHSGEWATQRLHRRLREPVLRDA